MKDNYVFQQAYNPNMQIVMYVDAAVFFDNCDVQKTIQTPTMMHMLISTLKEGTAMIRTARKEARIIDPALELSAPI